MSLDKNEILVGTLDQEQTIGAVLWADKSTNPTLPTIEDMDVTEGYTGLGYLVEDSFSIDFGNESEIIKEHNLGAVRVVKTSGMSVITLTLMQTNADNMKVMVGDENVTEAAATREHGKRFRAAFGPGSIGKDGVLQVRIKDGDRAAVLCQPNSHIQDFSEVEIDAKNAIGWECEFVGLSDGGSQESLFIIYDDGEVVSA